ncbi:MAG: sensor domain-containing phosphodiesterase [Acidimicrobiales bacterium]
MEEQPILVKPCELEAEPFLTALAGSSFDAFIGKSLDGRVVYWNAAAERLYGYSAAEILGHDFTVLMPRDRPQELATLAHRSELGEKVIAFHTNRIHRDGATIPVSLTISPVLARDGSLIGTSTVAHDLRPEAQQVDALERSEHQAAETLSTLEALYKHSPVGFAFVDCEFRIRHINDVLAGMNGSPASEQLGKTVAEVVPDIWPQTERVYRHVAETGQSITNLAITGETPLDPGRIHHWLASYFAVRMSSEVIGVGTIVVDVTEREAADALLRVAFSQMDEGLILTDADGELLLMNPSVTEMLGWTEEDLRGQDLHALLHTQHANGTHIIPGTRRSRRSGRSSEQPEREVLLFACKDGSQLSVSLAVAPISGLSEQPSVLMVFKNVSSEQSEQRRLKEELDALAWVGRIREALDDHRLLLHSQPIVPLTGGRASEELLLRMVARDGKLIAPGEFLGVAEQYSLINEIDEWVIGEATGLAALGRHVGVNISARSIATVDLVAVIEREIERAGASPSNLVFEITETALMQNAQAGEDFARGVRKMGCELALDDFGTGFGTFKHLKTLPVNYLKIDTEFICELSTDPANAHVVRAVVNLAKAFGCKTVAEGVEDVETLGLVQDLGVDFAQGFYLGRPTPV